MPLSLPILAAAAPGHSYRFVDLLYDDEVDFDQPADLVGISVRATSERRAYEIADKFRERGTKVVLGGPQVSAVPFRALQHADSVVIGEAEELWGRLVDDVENGDLKELYVCSPTPFDSRGHSSYCSTSLPTLAKLPKPRRDIFSLRYRFDTVFASRGCPIDCDFCSVPGLFGRKYRLRPVREVVDEIDTFKGYYYLLDDNVLGRPSTYEYYLSLYKAIASLRRKRYWTGQANLDAATHPVGQEVIRAAAESGLLYAAVGMESTNPDVLAQSGAVRKMGIGGDRNGALESISNNVRFLQEQGIIVSGWFVVGYEGDTADTFHRTWEFCRQMNIIPVIFPVRALPGTRLHERLGREGKLDDSKPLNYRNPDLTDEAAAAAMETVRQQAFSLPQILKRTIFYSRRFRKDRIHKTVYCLMLQLKLRHAMVLPKEDYVVGE